MAKIAVKPIVMRASLLSIGTDDYEKHVSGVTITPSTGTVNWAGLDPESVFTFPTAETWTVTINYAQDWETTNSLSLYLMANAGTKKTMTFEPVDGGQGFTLDVYIASGAIGGEVNAVATASVTLGVVGKPALAE